MPNTKLPDSTYVVHNEISMLDTLNFLHKYKKKIFVISLAAGALSAVVVMLMPSVYTAKVKIVPVQQSQQSQQAQAQAQVQGILESGSLADAIVQKFNLVQIYAANNSIEARELLIESTHVKSNKDASITIEVDDVDPKRAAALANAYPEELDKIILTLGLSETARQLAKIELRMENLNRQLAHTNGELNELGTSIPADVLVAEKDGAHDVALLRAQLDFISEADINLSNLRGDMDKLREQLAHVLKSSTTMEVKRVTNVERKFLENYRLRSYLEASMELLKNRHDLLKLEEKMSTTRVLDPAVVPEKRSKPKRLLIVVLTMFAAGFLTILTMLLRERVATIR